jgi:drug/metabolite transporter (DMT)-like permease
MIYILLSIACNITVAVLLKLAKRYEVNVFQAITWNYSAAALLSWFFLVPGGGIAPGGAIPFGLIGGLGLLLPAMFFIIAGSLRLNGIARTDVAQRLSLFIPVAAAFLLFREQPTPLKVLGVVLGLVAVLLSLPRTQGGQQSGAYSRIYLLSVFAGMGLIDILFKQLAAVSSIPSGLSQFYIYCVAFTMSALVLLILVFSGKTKFSWKHTASGWVLGAFNFGNILFYIKAHQAEAGRPSLVFAAMNIGVIVAGSVVGLWLFDEKLSRWNKAGIVVAIAAILALLLS